MADVPFGVLLSGGLDSSLVASVIARLRRKRFLERGDPSDLEPLKVRATHHTDGRSQDLGRRRPKSGAP